MNALKIFPLAAPAAETTQLLEGVLSTRTILTGESSLRTAFAAQVIAGITKAKAELMGQKFTKSGRVLLVLPVLGTVQRYSKLVDAAGGDLSKVDWTYDSASLLKADLSEYALVVVDTLAQLVSRLRDNESARDVDLPNHLGSAQALLILNDYQNPKTGTLTSSPEGEAAVLNSMGTHIYAQPEYFEVTMGSGTTRQITSTGDIYVPPTIQRSAQADWFQNI